jgi:hypothetical protein
LLSLVLQICTCVRFSTLRHLRKAFYIKKDLFWLMDSEISTPDQLTLLPTGLRQYSGRTAWQRKAVPSWWPGSRERNRKGQGTIHTLQWHVPSDIIPPTKLPFLTDHSRWPHRWISLLMKLAPAWPNHLSIAPQLSTHETVGHFMSKP